MSLLRTAGFSGRNKKDKDKSNDCQRKSNQRSCIKIPEQSSKFVHSSSFDSFRSLKAIVKQTIPDIESAVNAASLKGKFRPERFDPRNATPNQNAERLINRSAITERKSGLTLIITGQSTIEGSKYQWNQ